MGYMDSGFKKSPPSVAIEMNRYLEEADIPKWMTKGKSMVIQKEPDKGTILSNFRPITC